MTTPADAPDGVRALEGAWADACLSAALVAIDPPGLGGVRLTARHGPVRDRWLEGLKALWPGDQPLRRMPATVPEDRLLGGLDLGATLAAGRPVAAPGLIAEAHGGALLLPMAERADPRVVCHLATALDEGRLTVERDGMAQVLPTRIGVIALDERGPDDPGVLDALSDRLALQVDLDDLPLALATPFPYGAAAIAAARAQAVAGLASPADAAIEALTSTAAALGIGSLRAPILAVRTARALMALFGSAMPTETATEIAARLVLAPRAQRLPAETAEQPDESPPPPPPNPGEGEDTSPGTEDGPLADRILEATLAALPPGVLARLAMAGRPAQPTSAGRAGAEVRSGQRGRPIGARPGRIGAGRVDVVSTLQAAAPWQRLRAAPADRIAVRTDDIRLRRHKSRSPTASIFLVDASGSAAAARLAEAKGAVELLLAEAYVRRDRVALIAFRGEGAEMLLPPTAAPALAKRRLAALPGGGGTPLAAGLAAGHALADRLRRDGIAPALLVLTDGRANIALSGKPGRADAMADALAVADAVRRDGITALLIDTSPRPRPEARTLAERLGAGYLPLPRADAAALRQAATASRPAA